MARRMYDLDNGTEDIKVKSIENQLDGLILKDAFEHNFTIDDVGFKFITDDELVFIVSFREARFNFPVYFSPYTTALRPTEDLYEGAVIYDSTLKKCILWDGAAWVNLDGTVLS